MGAVGEDGSGALGAGKEAEASRWAEWGGSKSSFIDTLGRRSSERMKRTKGQSCSENNTQSWSDRSGDGGGRGVQGH